MIQSFSAKGHPYDNAVMECFFKYLKKEELNRRNYQTLEQLKQSLVSYISGFYNSVRPTPITTVCLPIRLKMLFSIILLVHFIDYCPFSIFRRR